MASNINANNIDGAYPVAGVDNDSQGFRTNFTNIKNNFSYAKTEITDLQAKAILKSALTGTALDNNMAGSILSSAEIKDFRETRYDLGSVTGTVTLNHANGHYQQATTSDDITITFSNLPAAGKVGRIKFEITVASTDHTLTIPAAVSLGTKGIAGYNSSTYTITFSETGTYIFEFTTDDAGTTYHIQDLSRPRNYFHSNNIRLINNYITDARGASGDVAGMLSVDTTTPAIWLCTGTYDGTTLIWRKAELETIKNEVMLTANAAITGTSSSSFSTITDSNSNALQFRAESGVRYRFEAFIPFTHSATSTYTHTFAVAFDQGTCNYMVEIQGAPTTAPITSFATTSDATGGVATSTSSSAKMCRITGTYYTTAGNETVRMRYKQNNTANTLTVLAGAFLRFNRV